MTDFLAPVRMNDVNSAVSFANYCQYTLGVPKPTGKEYNILKKRIKDFFVDNPQADWGSLCRVADWCLARRKRPARTYAVVSMFRYAWSDGFLPELDPGQRKDPAVEAKIELALKVEFDENWRDRLQNSLGLETRREVYEQWTHYRQPTLLAAAMEGTKPKGTGCG